MPLDMLLRMGVGLLVVLGLLVLLAAFLRFYGPRLGLVVLPGANPKRARLAILETRMLDARHRLVLFSRDEIQHLIILGGAHPVVVEAGMKPASHSDTGNV